MFLKYKPGAGLWLFILRNAALYFLMLNASLHLRDILNPLYLSIAFACSVCLALVMERMKLRLWAALLVAAVFPFLVRALLFFIFHLLGTVSAAPGVRLLFLLFDKDFFPFLPVYAVVWLFNFLARRYKGFVPFEIGFNILFLVIIFWTESSYRTTLYSHPSFFAAAVIGFVLCEILVLFTAGFAFTFPDARAGRAPERGGGADTDKPGRTADNRRRTDRKHRSLPGGLVSYLWIVVPLIFLFLFLTREYREESVRHLSGLLKPTLFQFDLSEFVRLQSEIELSDELVLLMRTDGTRDKYLLRRYILGSYDPRKGFYRPQQGEMDQQQVHLPDHVLAFHDPGYGGRTGQTQEYYLVNFDTSALVALNYPVTVIPFKNWPKSSFTRVYRVVSRVLQRRYIEFDTAPGIWETVMALFADKGLLNSKKAGMDEKTLAYYTDYGRDAEIRGLAEAITKNITGYYNRVGAIYAYLKNNYYYSLKPGIAEDGNQLHHFLFTSKKGYCSYFAFGMALLCRSLGIPARVAVGFYVGKQSRVPAFYHSGRLLNFYEVRAYQAHAWVEVYFNRYGWIEFDPTSTRLAPGEDFNLLPGSGGSEPDLKKLIGEILNNRENMEPSEEVPPEQTSLLRRLGDSFLRGMGAVFSLWYVVLPLTYLLIVLLAKYRPYLLSLVVPGGAGKIKYLYAWCLNLTFGMGHRRTKSESLLEYAKRLQAERGVLLADFTRSYLKAVFSTGFGASDFREALQTYKTFTRSLRAKVNPFRRFVSLLNPCGLWRKKL